jgi:hypothetical protein
LNVAGVGLLARENIQDDSGGGDGFKMQGAAVALAKPNGPVRAYRINRRGWSLSCGQRFSENAVEVALVLHKARARDHIMVRSPII